ncbi:hypothetical protein MtrunA17_Chr4g0054841 [Medicago truncatula]|uniref:Uncharacterized protein n=1 Tax=Medicago truncatula TaxID=3880 RepID=A0A396IBZ7_MEDTR|nr:hypothetical protein MtrunA17_Chr4g0054841 [Medicago truncatula]
MICLRLYPKNCGMVLLSSRRIHPGFVIIIYRVLKTLDKPTLEKPTPSLDRGAFISRRGNDRFENQLVDNFGVTPVTLFLF